MLITLVPVTVTVARSLRARVRVHVVTGNDVHPNVGRWSTHVGTLSPRHGHRRFAATVVEQIDVSIAEVFVGNAVDDVVEAGLAESDPGGGVEHTVGHIGPCVIRQHDAERQPECDEDEEAPKIGASQIQIPGVREAGLEVRRAHETFNVDEDTDVTVQGEYNRQQDQYGNYGHLV